MSARRALTIPTIPAPVREPWMDTWDDLMRSPTPPPQWGRLVRRAGRLQEWHSFAVVPIVISEIKKQRPDLRSLRSRAATLADYIIEWASAHEREATDQGFLIPRGNPFKFKEDRANLIKRLVKNCKGASTC